NWMINIIEYSARPWKYAFGFNTNNDVKRKKKSKFKLRKKFILRGRNAKSSRIDIADKIFYTPPKEHVKPELLSLMHRRMLMI
ncbi:MAG: hypothetical protein ACFE8P_16165, partial [Promethearchaeota archaeon]